MTEGFYCMTRCDKACWSNMEIKPNHCEKNPDWKVSFFITVYKGDE